MHEGLTLKTGNLLTFEENFKSSFHYCGHRFETIIMVEFNCSYYFYFPQIVSIHQTKHG